MNIEDVTRLYELAMRALDAVLDAGDPALELLWLRVRASDRWCATAGGCPFAELMMIEVITTMAIKGWTSDRRVKRIHDFARLAGFLR